MTNGNDRWTTTAQEIKDLRLKWMEQVAVGRWKAIMDLQTKITEKLFLVNTGGMTALLAYMGRSEKSPTYNWSVGCFAIGMVLIVLYWARMFYFNRANYRSFLEDRNSHFNESLLWPSFMENEKTRSNSRLAEALAWASGLFALAALVLCYIALQYRPS